MSSVSSTSEVAIKSTVENAIQDYHTKILPFLGSYDRGKLTFVGEIKFLFSETAPDGFLICDGTTYNKADYPQLAEKLLSLTDHSAYEVSGDDTKFKVPDLQGEFIRGAGTNSHTNQGSGAGVGVHQDATKHTTSWASDNIYANTAVTNANHDTDIIVSNLRYVGGTQDSAASGDYSNFTSRPTNTSLLPCIAYKDTIIDLDFFNCGGAKFSKSDMYDTNERVIGKWIDGKPLYQKTFTGSWSIPWNTQNMKGVLSGVTPLITDVNIISARGYSESYGICCDIYLQTGSSWTFFTSNNLILTTITLIYTKTTDSANSFKYSAPTDYSTEEKIVGTWIDGKPLYQKTWTGLNVDISYANWTDVVYCPNISKLIDVKWLSDSGALCETGSGIEFMAASDYIKAEYLQNITRRKIQIITAQYTKTTDA